MKLYSKEDTTLFGEGTVSKLFKLEGFPSDFTLPLRVALKYNGVLRNEASIEVRKFILDKYTGEQIAFYDPWMLLILPGTW